MTIQKTGYGLFTAHDVTADGRRVWGGGLTERVAVANARPRCECCPRELGAAEAAVSRSVLGLALCAGCRELARPGSGTGRDADHERDQAAGA